MVDRDSIWKPPSTQPEPLALLSLLQEIAREGVEAALISQVESALLFVGKLGCDEINSFSARSFVGCLPPGGSNLSNIVDTVAKRILRLSTEEQAYTTIECAGDDGTDQVIFLGHFVCGPIYLLGPGQFEVDMPEFKHSGTIGPHAGVLQVRLRPNSKPASCVEGAVDLPSMAPGGGGEVSRPPRTKTKTT